MSYGFLLLLFAANLLLICCCLNLFNIYRCSLFIREGSIIKPMDLADTSTLNPTRAMLQLGLEDFLRPAKAVWVLHRPGNALKYIKMSLLVFTKTGRNFFYHNVHSEARRDHGRPEQASEEPLEVTGAQLRLPSEASG